MKFEEAYDKVFEQTPPDMRPKGNMNYPKLLAFLWSMIAVSENVLDDTAFINDNSEIVSMQLQKSSTTKKDSNKKEKSKIVEEDNDRREEEPTIT